jgi:predicted DNA binding protein
MSHLRIELQFPTDFWLSRVSRAFPQQFIWVLTMQRLRSGGAIAHIATPNCPAEEVQDCLEKDPDVKGVIVLERNQGDSLFRVNYLRPVLVPILEATGFLPCYPFAVMSGRAYWEFLGVERESRKFIRMLEERLPGSRVRAVFPSHAHPAGIMFTPRQEVVLKEAVERGYYSFPRRITLTKLAKDLGVDKGSLSVMLVRIEERVVDYWRSTGSLPRPWVPTIGIASDD